MAAAVVLACVCVGTSACFPANAYADTELPSQEGSIIIHLYQTQSGGTEPGTGGEGAVLPPDAQPVSGVPFVLKKLSDDPMAANGFDPGITVFSPPISKFTPRLGTTDAQGMLAYDDLERGVYLLEQSAADGYRPAQQRLLVAVPMDGVAGSASHWDVHVYPKSYPVDAISKTAVDPQAIYGVGDEARWKIVQPVPVALKHANLDGTLSYGHSWQLRDVLDERLDFVAGASIELLNAAGEPASTMLVPGTDVVESYDAVHHRVTWDIDDKALQRVADSDATQLVIVVTTRLNERAYDSTSVIYNNAQVSFESATKDHLEHAVIPDSGPDAANPAHPRIQVGGLVIDKRLASTGMKLPGAVFKVALTRDDALAGRFLTRTVEGQVKDIELTTDANGSATLGGLKSGAYWLSEVQAPSFTDQEGKRVDCVRLVEPAEVRIGTDAQGAVVTVAVDNRPATPADEAAAAIASTLARTGDAGWFVLVVLVAGAFLGAVGAWRRRRKAASGEEG